MSEDDRTREDGDSDRSAVAEGTTAEVTPEALKDATVDLDVAIETLAETAETLESVGEYTEPIEREVSTLRGYSETFEAWWFAIEGEMDHDSPDDETLRDLGFDPSDAAEAAENGTDLPEPPDPVGPEDLAEAESAREDALLEAVAALEVARTELDQAIEDLERRL